MPIKFSELEVKPIANSKQVVGLYTDTSSTTGVTNCIINVADFATSAALTNYVNNLSGQISDNNNKAVHNVYDETVGGSKTFTSTTIFKASPTLRANNSAWNDSSRESAEYTQLNFQDKNSVRINSLQTSWRTNGARSFELMVRKSDNSGWEYPLKIDTPNSTAGGDSTVSANLQWTFNQTIKGTAYRAQWGDLAEHYLSDNEYPKGTLVQFGGEKEITIATTDTNAVITSEPGVILNGSMENSQAIALVGRVPVRVIGKVKKFDYLMLSNTPGVAIKKDEKSNYNVIARVLEDKDTEEEGLVLCATKFAL